MIIGKQALHKFKLKHNEAKSQIESWEAEVKIAKWDAPYELKKRYPKASLLKNQHAVFDICGNKYRLLVQISYKNQIVFIKKIGTHKEYDGWKI